MQDIEKMTPEEISEILDKVQRLYEFYKSNKMSFFALGRKNGKSLLAYKFMKEYAAITTAYEKAERKVKRKYGYLPQTAAEQVFYILKHKAHELRLRFRLWKKLKKHCRHCCLWCRCFKPCRSDVEADNDK